MLHLKPSNIFYSQGKISADFRKGCKCFIGETLDDLCEGRRTVSDIKTITVVKRDGKWFSVDNRRLWVFKRFEEAGKCETIPVLEEKYYSGKHDHKFDSTNGGESVTFHHERSPGGTWYSRIKSLTSSEVTQDKHSQSDSENENEVGRSGELEMKSSDESVKMNKNIKTHVASVSVSRIGSDEDQTFSLLKTSPKDEKVQLTSGDGTYVYGNVGEKFSSKEKGNAIAQRIINSSLKQPQLSDSSKLNRTSTLIPFTLSLTAEKDKTCAISNTLKCGEPVKNPKAHNRFKPYDLSARHANRTLPNQAKLSECVDVHLIDTDDKNKGIDHDDNLLSKANKAYIVNTEVEDEADEIEDEENEGGDEEMEQKDNDYYDNDDENDSDSDKDYKNDT